MKDNRHQEAIPQAVLDQINTEIAAIKTQVRPYAVALTPQERHSLLKMGDKSLAFVEKAHEYAHDNPQIVPSFLDMGEFDIDFSDAHGLWGITNSLRQLLELFEDTVMVAGSEAMRAALAVYENAKSAAKNDVPGAKAVAEELSARFPGGKRNSGTSGE
jgi:hypothetical protein